MKSPIHVIGPRQRHGDMTSCQVRIKHHGLASNAGIEFKSVTSAARCLMAVLQHTKCNGTVAGEERYV